MHTNHASKVTVDNRCVCVLMVIANRATRNGQDLSMWKSFCLCLLDGQYVNIQLGNRTSRIQHALFIPQLHLLKLTMKKASTMHISNTSSLTVRIFFRYATIFSLSLFASLYISRSFSSLVICHSLHNLLFSDTAGCITLFHHNDSFPK